MGYKLEAYWKLSKCSCPYYTNNEYSSLINNYNQKEIKKNLVLARGWIMSDHGFYEKDHEGPFKLLSHVLLCYRYLEVLTLNF